MSREGIVSPMKSRYFGNLAGITQLDVIFPLFKHLKHRGAFLTLPSTAVYTYLYISPLLSLLMPV